MLVQKISVTAPPKTMNNPKTNETAEILSYANQIPPDQVTVTTNVVIVIIKVNF